MHTSHLYINQKITVPSTVTLDEKKSHHLKNVLRIKAGEAVTLFGHDGHTYQGTVIDTHGKQVSVDINLQLTDVHESPCHIRLIQGLCRFDKMDWIVQKVSELGIHSIYPCLMQHSDIKIKGDRATKKQQHWQQVAIAACEQAKRQRIPEIHPIQSLTTMLSKLPKSSTICVLDPYSNHGEWPKPTQDITLIIGPEGGFSETEMTILTQHSAQAIQLGPRILRTETAAITACSLAQYCYGDLSGKAS